MAIDERIRRELERAARPADPAGIYEELIRRRERRRMTQRLANAALAIAVLAGTLGGFLALTRVFGDVDGRPGASTGTSGLLTYVQAPTGGGGDLRSVIWTMRPDGSSRSRLLTVDGLVHGLDWAPDGRRLALADGETITIVDTTTGGRERLELGRLSAYGISWSPDGTRIAASDDRAENDVLYVVELATGAITELHEDVDLGWTDWSPDGQRIAFVGPGPDPGGQGWDIYVLDVDGGDVTNLTDSDAVDLDPRWSPDGSTILFRSRRDGVLPKGQCCAPYDEIYVMGADGSHPTRLTEDASIDQFAVWSPDGSSIAYTSQRREDEAAVVVMRADGSEPVRLDVGALVLAWQPIPAAADPSPTPRSPDATEPSAAVDERITELGSGLALCDITSLVGSFEGPVAGAQTAFVGMEPHDGTCRDAPNGTAIVAVDLTNDGVIDVASSPIVCEPFCSAFAAPDIDGDGWDELLVQNVQFSIAGVKLYEVIGDREIVPITIGGTRSAPLGDGGFEAGSEPQFWVGGDAGEADAIRCEPYDGGPGRSFVSVTSHQDVESTDDIAVTETTMLLKGTFLNVVDVREFTWPIGDAGRPFLRTDGCGADLDPYR